MAVLPIQSNPEAEVSEDRSASSEENECVANDALDTAKHIPEEDDSEKHPDEEDNSEDHPDEEWGSEEHPDDEDNAEDKKDRIDEAEQKPDKDTAKFICTFEGCLKVYSHANSLKNHMRLHTEADPFKCPIEGCNVVTTSVSALYSHKKRKHPTEVALLSRKRKSPLQALQKKEALEKFKTNVLAADLVVLDARIKELEAKRDEVATELKSCQDNREGLVQVISILEGKMKKA